MAASVLKKKRVLLVGDAILDVYIHTDRVNEALYAPVPEVEERHASVSFGGNGLVAANLLELGAELTFISVIGNDAGAKQYRALAHKNLKKFLVVDPSRVTTVKQRWWADGKALLQANQVDNHDLSLMVGRQVISLIAREAPKADAIVVMDPQHGMLTKRVIRALLEASAKHARPLYIDAQISHRPSNHRLYKGAGTMVLNEKEAKAVYPRFSPAQPEATLRAIQKKFALTNVVVKLGAKGSAALWGDSYIRTPGVKVKAVDVCGAGDAFLAALALCDPAKPHESLALANRWAALSTTIHGTIPPKKKDLLHGHSK